jgi:hypothetical protein
MLAPRDSFASCAYKSDIQVFGGSVFKFDTEANEWSTPRGCPVDAQS